jgi:hypothetical protein
MTSRAVLNVHLKTFKRKYDRLASDSSVLEVPISGQHRLLATYQAGRLDLLAVGDHDLVPQFSQTVRKANRVEGLTSAPRDFWPIEGRADSLFLTLMNMPRAMPTWSKASINPKAVHGWAFKSQVLSDSANPRRQVAIIISLRNIITATLRR